jgi:acetyl esterase/lipase
MYDPEKDERLDPRARAFLSALPASAPEGDVASRDELLAQANSAQGLALREMFRELCEALDDETIAPRDGLRFADYQLASAPDGNTVNLQFIRPDTDEVVGCVYYIHGGGMATMSCYYGNYRTWGRLIAREGVAVAMIDFRNSISASSVPEVAPYPAGLNDCVSGLGWVHEHASELGVDPSRVVVAGESGGGNLTLALGMKLKREGRLQLAKGLYALAPYIAGFWPQERFPSSTDNNGIFITLDGNRGQMGYGIEAFDAQDPLAWPGFASDEDVRGLVPTVINVNECDPLRDEGIDFYRLLVRNGVPARCRQMMGTVHANELIPSICPDVSRDTARDIAAFCRD